MNEAKHDPATLKKLAVMNRLATILKTNIRACKSVGPAFISQISRLHSDLLKVHKFYSEEISCEIATKAGIVQEMKKVERKLRKCIATFISVASEIGPVLLPSSPEYNQAPISPATQLQTLTGTELALFFN
jgi:exportin-1